MKNIFCVLIIIIFILNACKKSDNNNSGVDGKSCKMMTITQTQNGNIYNIINYNYDLLGNLINTTSINYGDTFAGAKHIYLNNILKYSYYGPKWGKSDTMFYFFNNDSKLDSTIEHDRDGTSLNITVTEYTYNSENKVVFSLSRLTNNSVILLMDSTFYHYTGNNVTSINQNVKHGTSPWSTSTLNITYDDKKNYYKTMGEPATSYQFWSENNIVQIKDFETGNIMTTINFLQYNESGYPIDFSMIDNLPHGVKINYICQ